MNIAEVSKLTSMTPNALRYYERIGLIPPIARTHGGAVNIARSIFAG